MRIRPKSRVWLLFVSTIIIFCIPLFGCTQDSNRIETDSLNVDGDGLGEGVNDDHDSNPQMIDLPELVAIELKGAPLKVVATTSIIGDVVGQVGGDVIDLTTLIGPGQDPHSYEPGAQDLTSVAEAQVIFVNGWDLEEGLVTDLKQIAKDTPVIPVSANILPLTHAKEDGEHTGPDPHVWFSIQNVEQWVRNIQKVFSALDPAHTETFERNAAAYLNELTNLKPYIETQLSMIPEAHRLLVTNHDTLTYFAKDYGFELIGTVIPAASTIAEPSASDLAALIAAMDARSICTLFTDKTFSDSLAQTVAAELDGCEKVKVLALYTGALGPPGSGADSYIGMFRTNVDTIVEGLK